MHIYQEILKNNWGIKYPVLKQLSGCDTVSFKVSIDDETQYILKEYAYSEEKEDILNGEHKVLSILDQLLIYRFPKPVRCNNNHLLVIKPSCAPDKIFQMQTVVPGENLSQVAHTNEMLFSLGEMLASIDTRLESFYHGSIYSRSLHMDLQYLLQDQHETAVIKNPAQKKLINYFLMQFREKVIPVIDSLRKSVIHGNANGWNVLTDGRIVSGLTNFNDICYSPVINELAAAASDIILDKPDPIAVICTMIEGYHSILPLQKIELDVLYYIIADCLCKKIMDSADTAPGDAANDTTLAIKKTDGEILDKWVTLNPIAVQKQFYDAAKMAFRSPSIRRDLLHSRHQNFSENLSLSYSEPIEMQAAAFQYMYDKAGDTYLDLYNNIPHVGHCHPDVVAAGQQQMALLNTNTRYLFEQLASYSKKLLAKFPESLNKIFFVNSGSAANDLAIRMAKTFSKNRKIAVMSHGYHGHTETCIDISAYKFNGKGGSGKPDFIIQLPLPDQDTGIDVWQSQISSQLNNEALAGFICEPIVGCGGQMPLPDGYFKYLYPLIRKNGGICISDEIQTGFGRLGSCYWGFEMYDVVPDIVTLGKPMGNGHPISAVVTTEAVANSFQNGMEFFSSFGGNSVSCAIGEAVLDVIENEKLQQNALVVGRYLAQKLKSDIGHFPFVGDIRGEGLFLGIEFSQAGKPKTELAADVKNSLKAVKILVGTDGPFNNIIKIKPPLCFNKINADNFIKALKKILSSL